jgi:alpha-tubulin suppressor-like RCC1 family protein/pimeloyl-ACP methyl ester carboxylesterase
MSSRYSFIHLILFLLLILGVTQLVNNPLAQAETTDARSVTQPTGQPPTVSAPALDRPGNLAMIDESGPFSFTTPTSAAPDRTPTFSDIRPQSSAAAQQVIMVEQAAAIAAGYGHTCAVTAGGGVKCWGWNPFGQLGDGTTADRHTPVNVSELTSGVTAIAAGGLHTCALTTGGGVKCWGWNERGQLGDGTTVNRHTPVDVSGLTSGVVAIATGQWHTCALTTGGGVKCWGWNEHGQLGDGTTTNRLVPADVSGLASGVAAFAAGWSHSCALTTGGGVKCWGWNEYGQLGDGTTTNHPTPVNVSGLASGVAAIVAGWSHTCALTTGGGIKCWGHNYYGQLGDGTATDHYIPVDVSELSSGVAAIAASGWHTCALTTGGGIKCWGHNGSGQLGDGTASQRLAPVDINGLTSGVAAVAAGGSQICALTTGGGIKCWGSNYYGQLGDGTGISRYTPVDVSGLTSGVVAIAAGGIHTCTLTTAGGVKCWGWNERGQLGDGTTASRYTPVDVSGLTSGVAAIAAGNHHTCALTTGGGVKCWGWNEYGQLGDGTTTVRLTPVNVSGLTSGVATIAVGGFHTCALLTGGGAKCWGYNYWGQLGDGTTTVRLTPVNVSGLTSGVSTIAAGSFHTCALMTEGGVKCWGWNQFGQLGDGTTNNRLAPVNVSGLTSGVAAITAVSFHTCALTTGGGVKCWGDNGSGQLGIDPGWVPVDVVGFGDGDTFNISGNIVDQNNFPIPNVRVSTNTGRSTLTNINGDYIITGLITGTYTLTPSKFGYAFNPSSRIVTVPPNATGQNLTGAIQSGSIPVVFLPGIMGSYLWNFPVCGIRPVGEIWLNVAGIPNPILYNWSLRALHLDPDGQGPANHCDQIRATALIDEIGLEQLYHRDFYRRFLDDLQNDYNQTVFEFPYDWRLDMETIALQLDTFIEEEVKPATGAESVILIGHSLGGLVSRQYTLDQTRAQKVSAVISVGTPYWGAPKAARHMREGSFPVDLLNIITFLDRDSVRAGHRNSPALMQILPSEKYFQQVGPYFVKDNTLLATFTQTDTFFKEHGQNAYLLNQAKLRHEFIDNFAQYLFVPHYILAANHKRVVSVVHEGSCWIVTCWRNIELLWGDETVPTKSATLGGNLSGNAQVCLYDGDQVSKGHSELMGESVIIENIGNLLSGNTSWCSSEDMTTSQQNTADSVYEITVWGENLVFVQDALGNYTGPSEEGLIINQIPLATYSLGANSVNILLPASGVYTMTIEQKSAEPIQVDVIDFQSFLSPDAFNRYQAALFMNVPSQTDGVGTLLLDPTDDMEELRLALDLDNDGTPDHVLPPTSVLDADGLQDMAPPITTITIEGTVDAWGFYMGMVTATISATDEGTGVLRSDYSLDGGQTWQTYTEPLSFFAEQVPVFEARSVDQAGNQEFPWATRRLRPYALYLPTIVR